MRLLRLSAPVLLALTACSHPAATEAAGPTAAPAQTAAPSAGMDCRKATSAAEKAICADPVLVGLDAELGSAWKTALSRSDDRDALLADQRQWLRQRDACIGMENARGCLRARYAMRTTVLRAVAGGFAWAGAWTRVGSPAGFELTAAGGAFAFKLDAAAGGHTGGIAAGRATPAGPRTLTVASSDQAYPCRLELRRVANQIELVEIDPAVDCGVGMGVVFAGRYVRDDGKESGLPWSLLTLDLVQDAAADRRVRALLGDAGTAGLIERCQMISTDHATPGLATCGVRGLYTVMEAALQQQGDTVRVAQIVDDEVHYWSSDPATRATPPPWFDTWRRNFADTPVRLMSVPGRPLLQRAVSGEAKANAHGG